MIVTNASALVIRLTKQPIELQMMMLMMRLLLMMIVNVVVILKCYRTYCDQCGDPDVCS